MSIKRNLEQWIAQLDHGGTCDVSDGQVSYLIRTYAALEQQFAESQSKLEKMAAGHAGLKSKGREVLKEAAHVYSHFNRMVDHLDGESVDGQTLHEFQALIESETPATDAFMAEVRAQGVDMLTADRKSEWMNSYIEDASEFAAQLRQGVAS